MEKSAKKGYRKLLYVEFVFQKLTLTYPGVHYVSHLDFLTKITSNHKTDMQK